MLFSTVCLHRKRFNLVRLHWVFGINSFDVKPNHFSSSIMGRIRVNFGTEVEIDFFINI